MAFILFEHIVNFAKRAEIFKYTDIYLL